MSDKDKSKDELFDSYTCKFYFKGAWENALIRHAQFEVKMESMGVKTDKDTFEITDDGDFKQLKGKTKAQVSRTPVFNVREGTVDYKGKTMSEKQYADENNKKLSIKAKQIQ